MKALKAHYSAFTAITVMLMIVVIIASVQSVFIYLGLLSDRTILNELNKTTTSTNDVATSTNSLSEINNQLLESNNQILASVNKTGTIVQELKEIQDTLSNTPVENQEILNSITSRIDDIVNRLDRISNN